MTEALKRCFCPDKRHALTWHGIAKQNKNGYFYVDFPYNHPPTKNTGEWERSQFHKIKKWGKKQ